MLQHQGFSTTPWLFLLLLLPLPQLLLISATASDASSWSSQDASANRAALLSVETQHAVFLGRTLALNRQQPQLQIVAHLGIPYAQPPLGRLRFADPLPWKPPATSNASKPEINATRAGPACLQRPNPAGTPVDMSEDCLYLSVHSPVRGGEARRPVLVWLHGGYLETGALSNPDETGDAFAWDLVATKQSLLAVEVAYRLGVFGFLTPDIADDNIEYASVRGNAGLKDQQLALAWVSENIEHFGGSNASVTLAGLDAGAAAVGWHLLNAASGSRFQRCIFLGGGPLAGWAFVRDRVALKESHEVFYRLAGCDLQQNRLACLRNLTATELNARQAEFNRVFNQVEFPAILDGEFLSVDPVEAFKRGQFEPKPSVLGVTSLEGVQLAYRAMRVLNISDRSHLTGPTHRDLLDRTFRYLPRFPQELTPLASDVLAVQLTAFAGDRLGARNFDLLTRALSQRIAACDSNQLADQLVSQSNNARTSPPEPVFVYLMAEPDGNTDEYVGAGHGQDAAYFFGKPLRRADYDTEQRELSQLMMSHMEGFLVTGNLTYTGWLPSTLDGLEFYRYLAYRSDGSRHALTRDGFSRQDCRLWSDLLPSIIQAGQTTSPQTPTTPDEAAEDARFWRRCNASINLPAIIAIAVGGCLVVLLIVCVVLVARLGRSSSHDMMELYHRVTPGSGAVAK